MKNLYKKAGIEDLTDDDSVITQGINKSPTGDSEDCRYVLLHQGRKAVYDRTFRNLKMIGSLRKELGVLQTDNWNISKYADFSTIDYRQNNASSKQKPSWHNVDTDSLQIEDIKGALKTFSLLIAIFFFIYIFFINAGDNKSAHNTTSNKYEFTEADLKGIPQIMHVNTSSLNLRESPNTSSRVLLTLEKYQNISAHLDKGNDNWIYAEVSDFIKGYVSKKYVSNGDGMDAYIRHCRTQGVTRPANGQLFKRKSTGPHHLVVNNNPGADALVKLKSKTNETVLAFYVRSGQTVKITDVPEGYYQFQYASGKEFSPKCELFLTDMHASRDPDSTAYISKRQGYSYSYAVQTYTLKRVQNGNFTPQTMDLSDF